MDILLFLFGLLYLFLCKMKAKRKKKITFESTVKCDGIIVCVCVCMFLLFKHSVSFLSYTVENIKNR